MSRSWIFTVPQIVEEIVQIQEQTVDAVKSIPLERVSERIVEQFMDVMVPLIREEQGEAVQLVPQDSIDEYDDVVDTTVAEGTENEEN